MASNFRLPFNSRRSVAVVGALLAGLAAAPWANAALQARDANADATIDGYYDTVLDITWLADANAGAGSAFDDGASVSDGRMTWANATSWAAGLNVQGVAGWRLPTADAACSGFDCNAASGELGYMFYVNLGGAAVSPIGTTHNANFTLFANVVDAGYWSSVTSATDPDQAISVLYEEGFQGESFKAFTENAAWAVSDGDVLAVPEPGSMAMFLAGLAGLVGWCARRQRGRVDAN